MTSNTSCGTRSPEEFLCYGSLINLFEESVGGYVTSTSSLEVPVGLQSDSPATPLHYEQTIFLLQRGDAVEACLTRQAGDDILKYGQTLRLLHHISQRYLVYHTERHAVHMKGNRRVLLGRHRLNKKVLERWRIMPRYRLRVEGEPVVAGDPVIFQAIETERYLGVSVGVGKTAGDDVLHEVSLGEDIQGFLIHLYDGDCVPSTSPPPLRCGDCVSLLHTEEHKYILADPVKRQCLLRGLRSHMLECGGSATKGRERAVAWYAASKEEVSYLSLFIIERTVASKGGALRGRDAHRFYRLRSLASGLYLQCSGAVAAEVPTGGNATPAERGCDRGARQESFVMLLTPDACAAGTNFQLRSASVGAAEFFCDGARIFLSTVSTAGRAVWVVAGGPVDADGVDDRNSKGTMNASLGQSERTHESVALVGHEVKSMRDGLEVRRLGPTALQELFTIRGLLPPLQRYIRDMECGEGGLYQVRRARESLRRLHQLCYRSSDPEVEDDGDALMTVCNAGCNVPNPGWQTKLLQQGVGELVLLAVRASLQCPYVRAEKLGSLEMVCPQTSQSGDVVATAGGTGSAAPASLGGTSDGSSFVPVQYSELSDLVDACFHLMTLLLSSRERYVESLQRYADFVMSCTLWVPSALKCVAAFYKNNPALVELPRARHRLNFFMGMLASRGRNADVFRILRLLASSSCRSSCNDDVVEAQRVILDHLVENPTVARFVFCPIKRVPLPDELRTTLIAQVLPEEATSIALAAAMKGQGKYDSQDGPALLDSEETLCKVSTMLFSDKQDVSVSRTFFECVGEASLEGASRQGSSPSARNCSFHSPDTCRPEPIISIKTTPHLLMVGIPNSLFGGLRLSHGASRTAMARLRINDSPLGQLLQKAVSAENLHATTFFPLEGLSAVMKDWPEIHKTLVPCLVEQLRLLAVLARGENRAGSRAFVFEWVTPAVLVEALRSEALPRRLHGALIELFANVMMDVDGSVNMKKKMRCIQCIGSWSEDGVCSGADGSLLPFEMEMSSVPEVLVAAKTFVKHYLKARRISGDHDVVPEYLAVLKLTEALLNAGAFKLSEYEAMMHLVMRCVNPLSSGEHARLEMQSVYDCKARALQVMNYLIDVLLVREALWLVDCFRLGVRPASFSQLTYINFAVPLVQRRTVRWRAAGEGGGGGGGSDDGGGADAKASRCVDVACGDHHLDGVYGEVSRGVQEELVPIAEMFTALLGLASNTRSSVLQRAMICLYLRSTNFLEELYMTAKRVQLLTAKESIDFYTGIQRALTAMRPLVRKDLSCTSAAVLANDALNALEGLLSKQGHIPHAEQLLMMQHAGVPSQLIHILGRVSVPLNAASDQVVSRAVTLLQTFSQFPATRDELRESVVGVAPLVHHNAHYIALLRTLFVVEDDGRAHMPTRLLADVIKCLYMGYTQLNAIHFLCDWLTSKCASVHATAQRQKQVWRAIISDPLAERCIHLWHSWCGDGGRARREALLMSEESCAATGQVCTHLELCRLLSLLANKNELVKAEGMLGVVFGQHSLDALLEVTTDSRVPIDFRYAYVQLLQALVLDDAIAALSLLEHRRFPDLLRMCMMDVIRYLQLLGGRCVFADVDQEVRRSHDAVLRCTSNSLAHREMDEARFGVGMYELFFFGPLCTIMQCISVRYHESSSQVSSCMRMQLCVVMNEVVDVMCDVVQFFFGVGTSTLTSSSQDGMTPPRPSSGLFSEVCVPLVRWTTLHQCLQAASESGFSGTVRWRGDRFGRLRVLLERHVGAARETNTSAAAAIRCDTSVSQAWPNCLRDRGGGGERKNEDGLAEGAHSLTDRWGAYLRSVLVDDVQMAEENQHVCGAGILLRSGARGALFMRVLFTLMPSLQPGCIVQVLALIRHIVVLVPNNPYDDSALLPLAAQGSDEPCITVATPIASRQTFLALWPGDESAEVPLPLVALVSEFIGYDKADVQRAALLAACTLLMRGHRGMQESYGDFCQRSPNGQLFIILRNHFIKFKDQLQTYALMLAKGITPPDAADCLTQMSNCRLELRVVQLLCAGQYAPMQTYLVAQPNNNISVNVMEAMVELLSMAPRTVTEVTAAFVEQLMSTITATLQGPCIVNQDTLVVYKAADYLTSLSMAFKTFPHRDRVLTTTEVVAPPVSWRWPWLGRGRGRKCADSAVKENQHRCLYSLQTLAMSTLLAIIEGRNDSQLPLKLVSTIDLSLLTERMDLSAATYEASHGPIERRQHSGLSRSDIEGSFAVLRRYLSDYIRGDHPTSAEELQDELALAVAIYTFFTACYDMFFLTASRTQSRCNGSVGRQDLAKALNELVDIKGQSIPQVLRRSRYHRQLSTKLAKIEMVRNGRLERVYFRLLNSAVGNLFDFRRAGLIRAVVRTSDNERIEDFFYRTADVIMEMTWYNSMRRCLLAYLMNFFRREINALGLLIVLVINLVMVISIRTPTSPYVSGTPEVIDRVLDGLGIINICLQSVLLLQAVLGPAVVCYRIGWKTWRVQREESLKKMKNLNIAGDSVESALHGTQHVRPAWHEWALRSVYYAVWHDGFLPHLVFLFLSVIGFTQHRIWYAVQMMQITINSPTLANLFAALRANFKLLLLTYALLLTFVLLGANISYYHFSELFNPLGARLNGFNCYTLSQCLLVHVDTLRSGGGVGDVTDWPVFFSKDGYAYWMMFYRIAYYVVVGLVGANLFLGVIIDSLTQHRTHLQQIQVDQEKKCFICGVERHEFDMVRPSAYDTHITREHNMWQYIYYLHYLAAKDADSYTGQESYVQRCISLRDLTFYPIGRSLMLSTDECGAVDGPSPEGGVLLGYEEAVEDDVRPPVAGTTVAGGSDSGAGEGPLNGVKKGDSAASADEATTRLISSIVDTALRETLGPIRCDVREITRLIKGMQSGCDEGSKEGRVDTAAPVVPGTVSVSGPSPAATRGGGEATRGSGKAPAGGNLVDDAASS